MRPNSRFWRILVAVILFGVAFGYLEAAVVIYLRSIYVPLRARFYPTAAANELFPLLTVSQLHSLGPEHTTRLEIELGRELATLLMLAGIALAGARNFRQWVAAFLVTFGIWDIAFYVFLRLVVNWPASPFTWDILFLLPVPWVGPVLAPILVSVSMILTGILVLWREYIDRPVSIGKAHWIFIVLGGAIILSAFMYDFPNIIAGGAPNPFHWGLFFLGELVGLFAFATALRRKYPGVS